MATPDYTKPILQSDSRVVKQTLLRGPLPGNPSPLSVPDHRRRPDLPIEQREIIEGNFAHQTTTRPSSSWSWNKTEQYVHHKDMLMLAYLYDYPVIEWVIDAEDARYAVEALLAREGMRRLNLSVHAENTSFSWWIRGGAAPVDDDLSILNEVEAVEDEQKEIEEVEEMEVEQEAATPEPRLASPNLSPKTDPAAREEPSDPADEQMSDLPQDDATQQPTIKPEPRRSTRVAQQKLKEDLDQQVKEESLEPNPRTLPPKRTVTRPKGSKSTKTVKFIQQQDQRPRRRSTRVSAKRSFADEPGPHLQRRATRYICRMTKLDIPNRSVTNMICDS
ncbi:unnamed protein product [Aureobasidium mustum]|uniref:Uncharacterized protein n=1 Tax=Aureobasidium mustum TaxID=2773714 RepID=A0A9N8PF79_9PEZI|nr:unnamed protein product [Aureobasidium mustum]